MTSTLAPVTAADRAALPRDGGAPYRRSRVFALPEVRWAAVVTVFFLLALPLQLTRAPAWTWGPLYALTYAAGGWEPGWAGLQALREKSLDVDLLMAAALGAAAIGQVMDGALLIVIFATSGGWRSGTTSSTASLRPSSRAGSVRSKGCASASPVLNPRFISSTQLPPPADQWTTGCRRSGKRLRRAGVCW